MSTHQRNELFVPADDDPCAAISEVRPQAPPLTGAVSRRIFEDALREATAPALTSARSSAMPARLGLSAALCACSAAGFLLIRSTAATHPAATFGAGVTAAITSAALTEQVEPLATHRFGSLPAAAKAYLRSSRPVEQSLQRSEAMPPPACGMTTFAILTPCRSAPAPDEDESILVCIVSGDGSDASTNPADQVPENRGGADLFPPIRTFAPVDSEPALLVGAALTSCSAPQKSVFSSCRSDDTTGALIATNIAAL